MADVISVPIDVSGPGDVVLIAGVPGKRIRVFQAALTFDGPEVTAIFKSDDTALTGRMVFYPGGAITLGMTRRRWLMTGEGEDLIVNLSEAVQVGGAIGAMIE